MIATGPVAAVASHASPPEAGAPPPTKSSSPALARLARSRERMAHWLRAHPPIGADPAGPSGEAPSVAAASFAQRHPLGAIAWEVAVQRWRRHPLFGVVQVVGRLAHDAVVETVRSHPAASLAGAAASGAALVACRPWRLLRRPASMPRLAAQTAWLLGAALSRMARSPAAAGSGMHGHPRRPDHELPGSTVRHQTDTRLRPS